MHPQVLPVDAQGHSRHFRSLRTGKFEKIHPVAIEIQRFPIRRKFIRHREPSQNAQL